MIRILAAQDTSEMRFTFMWPVVFRRLWLGERMHGAHLFTEARYHYAATGSMPTRIIPVTFGIRF